MPAIASHRLVRLALAVCAAGVIGAPAATADGPDSGIRGYVTFGPTPQCAVQHAGQTDDDCTDPYPGVRIRIHRRGNDFIVRDVRSNKRGRFRVELAPGRYVLDTDPPSEPRRVRVRPGQFTYVRFNFDSGIR
jgi:hypothetical protein